jgi:hypothetical protein
MLPSHLGDPPSQKHDWADKKAHRSKNDCKAATDRCCDHSSIFGRHFRFLSFLQEGQRQVRSIQFPKEQATRATGAVSG